MNTSRFLIFKLNVTSNFVHKLQVNNYDLNSIAINTQYNKVGIIRMSFVHKIVSLKNITYRRYKLVPPCSTLYSSKK